MSAVVFSRHSAQKTPWLRGEPGTLLLDDLHELLLWAFDQGASDISLGSDEPPVVLLGTGYERVGQRRLSTPELTDLLGQMYGAHASALITGGEALDFGYEIVRSRTSRVRFRVNATGGQTENEAFGVEISLRTIPEIPPSVDDLRLEAEIISAHREVAMTQGLVLTVGATGTGKTTVNAAFMRDVLELSPGKKVLTYEAPIEYLLSTVPNKVGFVVQTEIGRHVPSFSSGIANAMRRKPNVILVGEARDRDTIMGVIQAALTGHATYTTMHAHSVAAAIPRLVGEFPHSEQRGIAARLMDVVRLVVTQRLVPSTEPGRRVALREFLRFDQDLRLSLAHADIEQLQALLHHAVEERGQSLLADARMKFEQGVISAATLSLIEAEWAKGAGR